jgi:hypothetical protein
MYRAATKRTRTRTVGLIGWSVEGVHDDDAALHYEFDLAEDGDVREGIALDGDEVGELAALEGADLVLRVEKFGGRCGSGADGFERGEAAPGEPDELFVGGDLALELVRFLDDHAHFFDGERGRPPIRINLDEIGAVADLLADGATGLFGAANHLRASGKIAQIGRNAKRIVLAEGGDGARGDMHARTFDQALIDGVAKGDVGIAGALAFDVANAGKARMEREASVSGAFEGAKGLGLRGEVEDVAVGTGGCARHEVRVAVDEAGEERCAGEVDDFGGFWRVRLQLGGGADFLDALAFDEDGGVFEVAAGGDVEEAGGFDEDDAGGLCVGIGLRKDERSVESEREEAEGKFFRHKFFQHRTM